MTALLVLYPNYPLHVRPRKQHARLPAPRQLFVQNAPLQRERVRASPRYSPCVFRAEIRARDRALQNVTRLRRHERLFRKTRRPRLVLRRVLARALARVLAALPVLATRAFGPAPLR